MVSDFHNQLHPCRGAKYTVASVAAKDYSFDIVSRVDGMEVRNAVDQAQKELANRYDFRGSKSEIQFEKDSITLVADDEFKMNQLKDILVSKLLKRGIDMRQIGYGKAEAGTGMTIRQKVEFAQGIKQEVAKDMIKRIKDKGLRVQAQIQGEELRVTAKDKDELQKTIEFVKALDLSVPVNFVNYR